MMGITAAIHHIIVKHDRILQEQEDTERDVTYIIIILNTGMSLTILIAFTTQITSSRRAIKQIRCAMSQLYKYTTIMSNISLRVNY
jgi:hypothetical protein